MINESDIQKIGDESPRLEINKREAQHPFVFKTGHSFPPSRLQIPRKLYFLPVDRPILTDWLFVPEIVFRNEKTIG